MTNITIIGLTGPSGAGKTTLCTIADGFGIKSIDTDAVYHALLVPPSACLDELVAEFGKDILLPEGKLDRTALASIVFDAEDENKLRLKKLGEITHKYVLDETRRIIRAAEGRGERAIIVDAPALYESGFDSECDLVICLLADRELRLNRISERDNISEKRAHQRISGQRDDSFYMSRADYTLQNDGDVDGMKNALQKILSDRGLI